MSLRGGEHPRSFLNLLLEVALIAIAVFLGLLANNWHEDREHRAQAQSALRNFAGEMEANRDAVQREREYHETLARELRDFLASKEPATEDRLNKSVHFRGMHPIIFEHTAWDLALATQALSYIDPQLAFDISKVYTEQSAFQTVQASFLASAFTPASMSGENIRGLATAMMVYLGDVNAQEPLILQRYEKVIPEVKRALSGEVR